MPITDWHKKNKSVVNIILKKKSVKKDLYTYFNPILIIVVYKNVDRPDEGRVWSSARLHVLRRICSFISCCEAVKMFLFQILSSFVMTVPFPSSKVCLSLLTKLEVIFIEKSIDKDFSVYMKQQEDIMPVTHLLHFCICSRVSGSTFPKVSGRNMFVIEEAMVRLPIRM